MELPVSRNLFPTTLVATLLASAAWSDVPRVATDIAPVHSLVSRVMAGVGEADLVIPSGASPHAYSLRPSEAAALQDADIVFWIGPDLTPWLADAIGTLASDATVSALMDVDGTIELPFRENALFEAHSHADHDDHDDHGHEDHGHEKDEHAHAEDAHDHDHDHDHAQDAAKQEDHSHDDHDHEEHGHDDHGHEDHAHDDHDHDHAHGDHDPHAWLSIDNASVWLNAIAAKLSAADPDNAGAYFANAAAAREDLDTLRTEINDLLDPVRGRNFIVFHDAYQYFETSFDFPASGAISISDATDPSPARISEIQTRVKEEDISCVLSEPQFDPKIVAAVMDGSPAKTGVLDPLGSDQELGPDLYSEVLRNLALALADCLKS
jgi:zinc transport system substrate-binding protein